MGKAMSIHWEVEIVSRSGGGWVSPFMPMQEEEARALMTQLKFSKRLVKVHTVRRVEEEFEEKRPH
jgi:hypothetical protein